MKTCITCKNWWIEFEQDWSDVTPGNGFSSECLRDHWYMGPDIRRDAYQKVLLTAETCDDYEEDNA